MSRIDRNEAERILQSTLTDGKLSRAEKRALRTLLETCDAHESELLRERAFAIARERAARGEGSSAIEWLEGILKTLRPGAAATPAGGIAEVHFSPGDSCRTCIARLLERASQRVDICVFSITDDRLSNAILDCHRRGVAVRVLSDDEKALDPGSDVERLYRAGVQIRVDRCVHHMHHKFALFDVRTLITGSYNWTRSAAEDNRENVLVVDDPRLVRPFVETFEALWDSFATPS